MARTDALDEWDLSIINDHLKPLIASSDSSAHKFYLMFQNDRSKYTKSQMDYWKNVASGLRWALAIAKQRYERIANGGRPTVQQSRSDTSVGGGNEPSHGYSDGMESGSDIAADIDETEA